jgi:hypothetical protein
MSDDLNVSTIGYRKGVNHKHDHRTQTLEVVTARVLERLERDSYFFDQNPPPPLPCFEQSGK